MRFLTNAVQQAQQSKNSLVEVLRKNLSKPREPRSLSVIHASDLTKDFFCARKVALLDITKAKLPKQNLSAALAATFDVGDSVATVTREKWLGNAVIGNWLCLRCDAMSVVSRKPPPEVGVVDGCPHFWIYREVAFESKEYGFCGNLDALVDIDHPKWWIVEIKIISPDQFAQLVAPLAEHRLRTNLYMKLVESSNSQWTNSINLERAKILYISRGHGKKHHTGEILPFKEFDVQRNDVELAAPLERALQVRTFRTTGVMPQKVCPNSWCQEAKKCPVVSECFSGKFNGGSPLPSAI